MEKLGNSTYFQQTTNSSYTSENETFSPEITRTYQLSVSTVADYEKDITTKHNYIKTIDGSVWFGSVVSMGILGLVLNLFVILVVTRGANISRKVIVQIINLAVADLLMAIFATLNGTIYFFQLSFPNCIVLCRLYRYMNSIAYSISLLVSVVISIERFAIVFFPFRISLYRQTHKCIAMAAAWIYVSLAAIHSAVYAIIKQRGAENYCLISASPGWESLQFIVLSLVIITLYIAVFIKLCVEKASKIRCNIVANKKKNFEKVSHNDIRSRLTIVSRAPTQGFIII